MLTSVNNSITNNTSFFNENLKFCHSHKSIKTSNYKPSEKAVIFTSTTLGVLGSLAILAKSAKYSLKPSDMFKNIKNSYLAKTDFGAKEVIAMGAGSCIGGLAGGFIVDKDKNNRKSKLRESIMQIGNVSIPILTVHLMVEKIFKNASKGARAFAGLGGVFAGVTIANFVMNKFNNIIFNENNGEKRKMKVTDFSAHVDDFVVAASYISKSDFVHTLGRVIPIALLIPGLEVGNKTAVNK